jgi:hypothetical protein
MADTKAQIEAEKWIRETYLPQKYGQTFRQKNLDLRSKGQFKFDAVSDDNEIVAVISTSAGFTSTGKRGVAKLMKIRSDAFWFLMLERQPSQKLMIFTDQSMIDIVNDEKKKGRFPREFEILKVDLPLELAEKIVLAQKFAADEVTPRRALE